MTLSLFRYELDFSVRACVCIRSTLSVCTAGAAARPAVHQGHHRHEGDGAPGVARQVHEPGDPVRPRRPPPARVAAAVLRRCACVAAPALGAGPRHRAVRRCGAAGRGLPRRARAVHASLAAAPGPTGGRVVVGRNCSAAARAQARVCGAADGRRLAQAEGAVSSLAA
jgi:hypothetical protein